MPEGTEQLFPTDGAILMLGQISEEIKFRRGKGKRLAMKRRAAQRGREDQRTEAQFGGRCRIGGKRMAIRAPQECADARDQLQRQKRLDQIIVPAERQTGHTVVGAVLCRYDDDRQVSIFLTQLGTDAQSVRTRHHDIQNDQIGHFLRAGGKQGVAV